MWAGYRRAVGRTAPFLRAEPLLAITILRKTSKTTQAVESESVEQRKLANRAFKSKPLSASANRN